MTDAIDGFAAALQGRGLSPSTVAAYTGWLNRFQAWLQASAGEDLPAAGQVDAQEYVSWLTAQRKPATAIGAADALRAWSKWREGREWEIRTPQKEAATAPKALDKQAAYRLRRAAVQSGPRDAALVALLMLAGLRVSEALALRPEDVAIRERSGQAVVRQGKGNKRRTVPLSTQAREMVGPWLAGRQDQDWLFPGRHGQGRMTRQGAWEVLATLAARARVEGVHPHALRHTFGKGLVDAGVSLDRVALLLGHSSLNTTARYTRPTEEDLAAAVERLGN